MSDALLLVWLSSVSRLWLRRMNDDLFLTDVDVVDDNVDVEILYQISYRKKK